MMDSCTQRKPAALLDRVYPAEWGSCTKIAPRNDSANRAEAQYWATGLSAIISQGRSVGPGAPSCIIRWHRRSRCSTNPRRCSSHRRTLSRWMRCWDPFSVYEKGEVILRQQLSALSSWHLVNIILA